MSENGNLPATDLAPIPGGQLRIDAAAAWLAMRTHVGKDGVWICPTSPRTAYRPLKDQQYFWHLYRTGKGPLAAVPGTSNHGWGIAVDMPSPAMQAAVRACGHEFGWGIRGGRLPSDAPSEAWHATFHPGVVEAPEPPKHTHPYHFMTDREREARDVLVKERRVARSAGGWEAIEADHLQRAVEAKKSLRQYARDIASAAEDTGWDKNDRKVRFDYINKLTGAEHG
jgi:hypothetical protein